MHRRRHRRCDAARGNGSCRPAAAAALTRGIDLVNSGELHKLVLAVRHRIVLADTFNPLPLLKRLRRQQAGSCRFLWQRHAGDAFFGASPERLLSLRAGWLRSDAPVSYTHLTLPTICSV